ncbi:hypothetical protein M5J15_15180 [Serratia symbiotica]|uniref:hypothetical protein n=1 Tax=Serratia symbiotica TaxID=138074 RepID=UPI001D8B18F7|nr:hypothetical protein [Serratia symbiotica]NIG88565.1 hypothetical protein [Serratia symbiotica]USS95626.1 hypothetical protein M5J15_15180 [Serratia symbiotica]
MQEKRKIKKGVVQKNWNPIMHSTDPVFRQMRRRISKGKVKINGLTLSEEKRSIRHLKLAAVPLLTHRSLTIYQTICVGTPQDNIPPLLGRKNIKS